MQHIQTYGKILGQKTKNRSTQENSEDKDKDDNNKKSRFCQRFEVSIVQ